MSQEGATILVVDDDPGVRALLDEWLQSEGFVVEAVASGAEAREKARARKIDLALVDFHMPGMDGARTTAALKEVDPDVEVIIVTGQAAIDTAIACMKQGAYDYTQKPFAFTELRLTIHRALAKSHLNGVVALFEASRSLLSTRDLGALRRLAPDLAARVLQAEAARLLFGDGSGSADPGATGPGQVSEALLRRVTDRVVRSNEPLRLSASEDDGIHPALAADGFASALVYPLAVRGGSLGTLVLFRQQSASPFTGADLRRGLVIVAEIAMALENARLYGELETRVRELTSARLQLVQREKLALAGQLAAGIAHEINTPIQFIGDSVRFLKDAFVDLQSVVNSYRALARGAEATADPGLLAAAAAEEERADTAYLEEQIPKAVDRTLEGVERVAGIVRAMKEFAHPDRKEKAPADLNRALLSTLTVARNELKYVAEVETDLGDLPPITCHVGDLNQVFLNLLVNAAHAIVDLVGGTDLKGRIAVRTWRDGDAAVVSVSDTGCGIPEAVRDRIFEPFFTTKEVGRGSGQGLANARAIVVEKHGGELSFESQVGQGTTFQVRLPIDGNGRGHGEKAA